MRRFEPAQPPFDHRLAMAAIHFGQEPFFVLEVVADAGDVDLRFGRQLAHRHAVEAALGEQTLRGAKDALPRTCPPRRWRGRQPQRPALHLS